MTMNTPMAESRLGSAHSDRVPHTYGLDLDAASVGGAPMSERAPVAAAWFLRAAGVAAAVQGLTHGAFFITAKPRHGVAEIAVVEAMKTNRFFAGQLGYWDYYFGYGLIAAAICLVEAVLFWQLSRLVTVQPTGVRSIVALFFVATLGHAGLVFRYFRFPIPLAFDAMVAALLLAAWVSAAGHRQSPQ